MKKSLILIILVFAFVKGNSQQKFGLRAGLNISSVYDFAAFSKNRLGWYSGLFFDQPLSSKLFLHIETIYNSKGLKAEDQPERDHVFRFNYLSIPILIGYKIDKRTSILLGPEVSYNTSVKWIINGDYNLNYSDHFPRKTDAGLCVAINYSILKRLNADIRYVYGFKTIYNVNDSGIRYNNKEAANRVFQMGVSYILN